MKEFRSDFSGEKVAFVIPTKDRPEKVREVLTSLALQTIRCHRVIVVNGGRSVKDIVLSFSSSLPVEYYECSPPGQIRQRNLAISLLDERTPLVGLLDDDIVLEPGALESMIAFWNSCEPETAGVSFNIINLPPYQHSWLRALIGMSDPQQGQILRSGYNTSISPVENNLKSQWLCGGATIWRQEILKSFSHKEINTRWAICEDIIFSYPIGKHFPLYVCAGARVKHEHPQDHTTKTRHRYAGRAATLWRFHFVESHPELSRSHFLWMIFGQIVARSLVGLLSLKTGPMKYAFGQFEGVFKGLRALRKNVGIQSILNE
jgi:glycosyltransferase involved in cell wall biosynthesis